MSKTLMSLRGRGARRAVALLSSAALVAGVAVIGSPASAASKAGGTLIIVSFDDQIELDPTRTYVGRDIAFMNSFWVRNLVSYVHKPGAAGSGIVGDLATNTGVPSNSAKTWKFTLRPGVTWEDGKPVTCADVKYGLSRTFAQDVLPDGPTYAISMLNIPVDADGNSAYAGPYKKTGQALYDKAVTCSKDNRTVTFNLSRSVYDFNYTLTYPSFSPVRKDKDTGEKYGLRPFSNGPYKIKKYKAKDELVLVRNTKWNKSSDPIRTPYPEEIQLKLGVNESVRDQIFINDSLPNAVSFDALLPASREAMFNDPAKASRRMNVYDPYVTYVFVNQDRLPCLDLRKAIFYARDLKGQLDLAGGSTYAGDYADGVIKPLMGLDYAPVKNSTNSADGKTRNLNPDWKQEGNPTVAKAWLEKAKKSCPDLVARATDPNKGLTYVLRKAGTNAQIIKIWQDAMDKIGVHIDFKIFVGGSSAYYSHVRDQNNMKNYDLIPGGWGPDWANASTVIPELYLEEGGAAYGMTWKSPDYDAFKARVKKNLTETNRKKQGQEWAALNQYAIDRQWVLPSFFTKTQEVWGSGIGGVYFWEPQGTFGFGELYVKDFAQ